MRSVLSFLFAFLFDRRSKSKNFWSKIVFEPIKKFGRHFCKFQFSFCLCKVGNGGERAGLEFVPSGVGVSVAWNLGYVQGCILGVSWAGYGTSWAWEAALLAYFVFVGSGWCLELGTGTAFLVAAGRVGEWVVHGTFLMNVYLVPQMKEGLHARLAEGVLGRELDLGGEKEVGDCLGVHHSCEGCVALGGPVGGQGDGSVGWVDPDRLELRFF